MSLLSLHSGMPLLGAHVITLAAGILAAQKQSRLLVWLHHPRPNFPEVQYTR